MYEIPKDWCKSHWRSLEVSCEFRTEIEQRLKCAGHEAINKIRENTIIITHIHYIPPNPFRLCSHCFWTPDSYINPLVPATTVLSLVYGWATHQARHVFWTRVFTKCDVVRVLHGMMKCELWQIIRGMWWEGFGSCEWRVKITRAEMEKKRPCRASFTVSKRQKFMIVPTAHGWNQFLNDRNSAILHGRWLDVMRLDVEKLYLHLGIRLLLERRMIRPHW